MKNEKIVLSKIAHSRRLISIRTSAALILTTLMLTVAAATFASAQTYTDLYNFDGVHGSEPSFPGVLAQGRDGNLYGTTWKGGALGRGVAFKFALSGNLKVLHSFEGGAESKNPLGGLTLGTDGNFYGAAMGNTPNDPGTIFRITKGGSLTTLHSFNYATDGGHPWAEPIQGTDGNFYGTTFSGTAYKITPSGSFTLLAWLPAGDITAPLLQATDGNFYGTAGDTVFKMTARGSITIVAQGNQINSEAPLIQGSDGNFYGTDLSGGSYNGGTVFQLTPLGVITILHNFPDPNYPNDGSWLGAGLVQATDGNFYGVTAYGGTAGRGVIFQITPAGAYSILYNFDGAHGGSAQSTPMQHTNGEIYGLACFGGTHGKGVVYSLDMGLGPFVRLVSTTGKVGKTIEVLGQGFTGTTAVSFNGTAANFTVKSDTYLTAIVPSNATTGFVTVTTPGGTLKSNQQFRVKP